MTIRKPHNLRRDPNRNRKIVSASFSISISRYCASSAKTSTSILWCILCRSRPPVVKESISAQVSFSHSHNLGDIIPSQHSVCHWRGVPDSHAPWQSAASCVHSIVIEKIDTGSAPARISLGVSCASSTRGALFSGRSKRRADFSACSNIFSAFRAMRAPDLLCRT